MPPMQPEPVLPMPLLCIACGYDLSGLPADGLCPECSLPIASTRRAGVLLRFTDPDWLRTVARGGDILLRSAQCGLIALLGGILGMAVPPLFPLLILLLTLAGAGALLGQTAGLFMLTHRHGGLGILPGWRTGACRVVALLFPIAVAWQLPPGDMARGAMPFWAGASLDALSDAAALALLWSALSVARALRRRTREWDELGADRPRPRLRSEHLVTGLAVLAWVLWALSGATREGSMLAILFPLAHLWWYDEIRMLQRGLAHEVTESRKRAHPPGDGPGAAAG